MGETFGEEQREDAMCPLQLRLDYQHSEGDTSIEEAVDQEHAHDLEREVVPELPEEAALERRDKVVGQQDRSVGDHHKDGA